MTYIHDTRCPVYGVPEWKDVDECGPCDLLVWEDWWAAQDA